ncbi:MAG: tyrosine-type recombinase/integrase [Lachnospiraceae bacterium]
MVEREEILSKYTFTDKPDSKGYYRVYVKDITKPKGVKQMYDKNLDNLRERVYQYHLGHVDDGRLTFQSAFQSAQRFKTENNVGSRKYSIANTIKRNESEYKRYFANTALAEKYLDRITVLQLDAVIRANLRKQPTTKKGLASMRAILNMIYGFACSHLGLQHNTAQLLNWRDYSDMLVEPTAINERIYSDEEFSAIRKYLVDREHSQPRYIPAYAEEWQSLTAMRRGEIPPLLWNDVDFEHGFIYIHQEQITVKGQKGDSNKIVPYTKNGKSRFYPLGDAEIEFLERLKHVHDCYYSDSPFLFPANSTNGCISNDTVYQFHRRMLLKLNIPVSREYIRGTHAFRRTQISNAMRASNGNVDMVAAMYGNSPQTIREHYYVDTDIEGKRALINAMRALT